MSQVRVQTQTFSTRFVRSIVFYGSRPLSKWWCHTRNCDGYSWALSPKIVRTLRCVTCTQEWCHIPYGLIVGLAFDDWLRWRSDHIIVTIKGLLYACTMRRLKLMTHYTNVSCVPVLRFTRESTTCYLNNHSYFATSRLLGLFLVYKAVLQRVQVWENIIENFHLQV